RAGVWTVSPTPRASFSSTGTGGCAASTPEPFRSRSSDCSKTSGCCSRLEGLLYGGGRFRTFMLGCDDCYGHRVEVHFFDARLARDLDVVGVDELPLLVFELDALNPAARHRRQCGGRGGGFADLGFGGQLRGDLLLVGFLSRGSLCRRG